MALGDVELAERDLRDGLKLCRAIKHYRSGAELLQGLACVAAAKDEPRRAAVLMAASMTAGSSEAMGRTTTSSSSGLPWW